MEATTLEITLGGRKWPLRYDLRAMQRYERLTTFVLEDGTVVRGSAIGGGGIPRSAHQFVALILACLESGGKAAGNRKVPTREQLEEWLSEEGALERIVEDVLEMIGHNSPEPAEGEEGSDGPPDPPKPETGHAAPTPSGSSTSG